MKELLKVPPTKSAMLRLKRELAFLTQGHDLLERKRELLTYLVYDRLRQYRKLRKEARAALEEAYRSLGMTHMRTGSRMLHQAALGLKQPGLSVRIVPRSSLGVDYPAVTAEPLALPPIGLLGTDASLDETRGRLVRLAVHLARLGEAETALRRLLGEQRKTQKRVNALKYNILPRYTATIRFIQSALEEEERNALFQVSLLQKRRGAGA